MLEKERGKSDVEINPGLEGIVVAETDLSLVDGQRGHLVYRGHWAKELALKYTFEEVVYLLWYGKLPNEEELRLFQQQLTEARELPNHIRTTLESLPSEVDMMSSLRTAVSALSNESDETIEQAISLLAKIPVMIAYRYRYLNGKKQVPSRTDLSLTANYLYMLHGVEPAHAHVRALEAYLILTAEHGLNASTFASRVVASTQSDYYSAITAAIGALKGPLHGGAPSEVEDMLERIGTVENAESWLRERLEQGERLMGFGHRVYKTKDPRAEALHQVAKELANEEPWFHLAVHVEQVAMDLLAEYKPGRRLYTNVEFYAAAVLRAVKLPTQLYTPTFTLSRTAGWTAHIMEQKAKGRIIRPQSIYNGKMPSE